MKHAALSAQWVAKGCTPAGALSLCLPACPRARPARACITGSAIGGVAGVAACVVVGCVMQVGAEAERGARSKGTEDEGNAGSSRGQRGQASRAAHACAHSAAVTERPRGCGGPWAGCARTNQQGAQKGPRDGALDGNNAGTPPGGGASAGAAAARGWASLRLRGVHVGAGINVLRQRLDVHIEPLLWAGRQAR